MWNTTTLIVQKPSIAGSLVVTWPTPIVRCTARVSQVLSGGERSTPSSDAAQIADVDGRFDRRIVKISSCQNGLAVAMIAVREK